jgi:hypothetical protein
MAVATSTPAQSSDAAARLTTLLSDFDPSAANFLEANHAALRPLFAGGTWAQFEQHVLEYAFAEAREELEHALEVLPLDDDVAGATQRARRGGA